MKRVFVFFFALAVPALFSLSCSVSLNGASTVGLKTINVEYFENNAPLVVNYLSQQFTESLKRQDPVNDELIDRAGRGYRAYVGQYYQLYHRTSLRPGHKQQRATDSGC